MYDFYIKNDHLNFMELSHYIKHSACVTKLQQQLSEKHKFSKLRKLMLIKGWDTYRDIQIM